MTLVRSVLAALLLLAALAVGLEGAVRLFRLQGDAYQRLDQTLGWTHIPGKRGLYVSPEATARFRIDRFGLVGPERTLAKPQGVRRVLLLGDSFTESLQVPYEHSWPRLLEAHLGPGWQTLNAGVGGYGTDNELLYLRHAGLRFDPDLVLVMVFTGNDVSDNDHPLAVRTALTTEKPYFILGPGGRLVLHPLPPLPRGPLVAAKNWLKEHSRLYVFLRERFALVRAALSQKAAASPGGVPLGWHVYRRDAGLEWERAWALTAALLEALRDDCERAGASLVVASLPTGWRVDPGQLARTMRSYPALRDTSRWDVTLPDARLAAICESEGIAYVPLEPALRRAARAGAPLYADHLNARGHTVVAGELMRALRRMGPLETTGTRLGPRGLGMP